MLVSSNFAIYMGDRWRPSLLGSSRYIWYPMTWDSGSPRIVPADVWSVNLSAGTFTAATGTTYEAESGTVSGSTQLLSDSSFSGGRAVGYLGGVKHLYLEYVLRITLGKGGSVTINNVQGMGTQQWVSLYYANGMEIGCSRFWHWNSQRTQATQHGGTPLSGEWSSILLITSRYH